MSKLIFIAITVILLGCNTTKEKPKNLYTNGDMTLQHNPGSAGWVFGVGNKVKPYTQTWDWGIPHDSFALHLQTTTVKKRIRTKTGEENLAMGWNTMTDNVMGARMATWDTIPNDSAKLLWPLGSDSLITLTITGSSVNAISMMYPADTIPVGKLDTLRVLMLITSHCREDGIGPNPAHAKVGYKVMVRRKFVNEPGTHCINCSNYWEFVMWLDGNKNKLKDCYSVWDSKTW